MTASSIAMRIHRKLLSFAVLIAFSTATLLHAEASGAAQRNDSLQGHYTAALHFQRKGDLDRAAAQYRAFLAGVLGELAVEYARLGDYSKAAFYFDDALALEPNSPAMRLAYATAAVELGDPEHAETLAMDYLRDYPGDTKGQAEADQILGRAFLAMNRYDDARKEFKAAVALNPTFANGYDLAVACLDLVDGKCASDVFQKLEKSYGDSPAIHMQFGRAYGESDFQQKAADEFRTVIAEAPRYPQAHDYLAAAMLEVQDDAAGTLAAEAELKKALAISPDDAFADAALGKIALSQQHYAEAEKYLKRATALDPKTPDSFLYLGQTYYDTNRPAQAEVALRQAIQLTTDVSRNRYQIQRAYFLLGRLLMKQHKETEAHAEMEIAHTLLNKTLARDKSKLEGLLDSQEPSGIGDDSAAGPTAQPTGVKNAANAQADRRLAAFEKTIAKTVADSYNNLGAFAAANKDYAHAFTYFQDAEEWNPTLEGVDYNWGRAAFSASRFSEAIAPLSRYLQAHPVDSGIRVALGISQYMTHDYSDCIQTLQPLDGAMASIPQVKYVYADSLVKTGKIAAGIERLQALEESHPEIADVHRALGEALESEGKNQQAIQEFQTANKLRAGDAGTLRDLGKAELAGGDASAAIVDLEAAVRLRPGDPEFHLDLANAYKAAKRDGDAASQISIYNTLRAAQAQPVATAQ